MTRSEAGFRLHKLLHNNSQAGARQLMSEVFDDFEKMLEDKQAYGEDKYNSPDNGHMDNYWTGYSDACGELLEQLSED